MTIEKVNFSLISIIIVRSVVVVNEGRGRLFRRKDGKYLLYVPLDLAEDSMFPFKTETSIKVKISFKIGENKLIIEEWKKESN
jgi:hypothetical protein